MADQETKIICTKEPFIEEVGPRRIKSIRFSTLSGEEIKKAAEVNVWSSGLYDKSGIIKKKDENNKQDENKKKNEKATVECGLLDTRMGAANKDVGTCMTCHGNYTDCPGHFGYINLVLPVYNVGFFSLILDILKCICKSCSRILLQDKNRRAFLKKMRNPRADALQKQNLVKAIRDKCKTSICPWCGYKNGTIKKKAPMSIIHDCSKMHDKNMEEISSSLKKDKLSYTSVSILDPLKVLSLIKGMIAEDCELLNIEDRPEKLMLTAVPVPPCPIRPSSLVSFSNSSNEDSLTTILRDIINWNNILSEHLQAGDPPQKCIVPDQAWGLLQNRVAEYINSESPCVFDPKGRGLVQRLKGKQGRFRGNLSGKRVEFTGRTVISPDPNLKITEVGVPVLMAMKLSYPERVSQHNIEKLRQRIRNGATKHPGANFVNKISGDKIAMKYADKRRVANDLMYGDIVDRHLEDGDVVLFNRQPSLHRMSIMCHRARIMPWRTLRFNESVCNPYNADFDGDEMNMHVPQTEEARTEALMLMGVQNNLCTPKNGEILVASTQDFLTTSFLITRKDTFYDRAAFCLMCSYMGDAMESIDLPTPALIKPIELWTGKQLFSVLIRPNAKTRVFVNFIVMEKSYNKKSGREAMCPSDGFVYFRNSELISGQLGKATLGNGNKDGLYSVLLRDYNAHAAASCMNRLAKLSARWIGNHGFSIGVDDVQPGEKLNSRKENKIEEGRKKCDEFISLYNRGQLTLAPGSNAAETLESEITGVLNQIRSVAGDVCAEELPWRNSPLIMSQCGSKGSLINISQMVACVGQQSVGGKRAPNGFIDRTLPHFPINSKTPAAKGFVANSFYSGLTPTEFFFHTMGGREGLVDTAVKTAETGYMSRRLMKGLEDLSVYYDQTVRNASGGVVQFVYGDDGMDPAKMEGKDGFPLNLEQLFMKVMATCPHRDEGVLSTSEILKITNERLSKPDMSSESSSGFAKALLDFVKKKVDLIRSTRRALKLDVEFVGNNKDSVEEKCAASISGISAKQLQVFLETCVSRYHRKVVEAGASMGAIGAQSIGEPGTQMTLKTFHFAGVASMNVTLGVPRIKEIINAAKNISTPIIEAKLLSNKEVLAARLAKSEIEKTVLGEVAKSVKVVLKSGQPNVVVKLDMECIKAMHLGINAESVHGSILKHPKIKLKPEHVRVIGNDKLRIYPPDMDRYKLQSELHRIKSMLPKVAVKGIPTAERVVILKEEKNKEELYTLYVEGTDLLAVMGSPGIDPKKTTSNHIMEIQKTLGIEAARQCIINEIKKTMEGHGMSIDIRHMKLLADLMTYKGEILGITRFGITKMKDSVLMLASFEKTSEHLFNASYSGREDQIEGVSESIIMGIPMKLGTGILKLKQRFGSMPVFKYQPDPIMS